MSDKQATEEKYRRKPVFEWRWSTWVGTILVLAILGAAFLSAIIALAWEKPFKETIGYTLALTAFPLALWLFWQWYRALHEEEEETRNVPLPGAEPKTEPAHDPILVRAFARPQLEAPRELQPDIILLAVRELWESGKLSRREAMRLRLPGGQAISRTMWERLVGGYQVEDGRRKNGLLAEAGLVQRTSTNSWAWREGLTLATVMGCFDVGGTGRAGDAQENPPVTLAEQRRQRWVEVGCDVTQYLKGR